MRWAIAAQRKTTAATLLGTALIWCSPAAAQDAGSVPASSVGGADVNRDLQLATRRTYWSGGKHRSFVSSTIEAGLVYYRPQIALGYGKPHWKWFGVEALTNLSIGGGQMYGGLRGALPNAELRVGARQVYSASQNLLERAAEYTDETIDYEDGPRASYLALEAELIGSVQLGDGVLFGLAAGSYLTSVPDGYDVYDQLMRVVVQPPWVARTRGGYVHGFVDGVLKIGGAAELIVAPERDAYVVRVGPQLGVSLTHHLDAAVSIMATVSSPDHLRLDGAEIGQFGFRYRWATGDPFPEFP